MGKIAIFGGSFDPVHKSHIKIAELAIQLFNLEKLIFVLAYTPPHKIQQYAKVNDRICMLKLAATSLQKSEISLYEVKKQKVVYSYQTLDYFQGLYPSEEVNMLIGSDSLQDLQNWKNVDYIIKRYKIIVAKRAGIKIGTSTKYLNNSVFINNEIENISSEEIRRLIKGNYTSIISLVDKNVYNYIIQNKLYK
ncbi:MAG: nicotinate (nicotinamide) nucleotide adenylyltransferase [Endomicrobium sp.]|jgi:nicotinate-nucleotide adenylyltransferase|nr:nicotinate (nicotinamide) nucleotide adenylyltransferase [Endomicrobium sp.]